jgi:tRNA pseudouridine55 synthase
MRDNPPMTSGIVLLHKPAGLSSNHATRRVQRLFGARSAGHLGTLDPFATGLLPVMLGDATRLIRWLEGGDKVYRAAAQFGATTDTLDREGEVLERRPVPAELEERLRAVLPSFVGDLRQRVPDYSAAKVGGVRRCDLARAGRAVAPKFKQVVVRALRVVEASAADAARGGGGEAAASAPGGLVEPGRVTLEVTCGPGTYVRQLVADLGAAVGCGAYTLELCRRRVGTFPSELAVTFEGIESIGLESRASLMSDPGPHLPGPVRELEQVELERLGQGRAMAWGEPEPGDGGVVFLAFGGRLRVVAERLGGELRPRAVLGEGLALGGADPDSV